MNVYTVYFLVSGRIRARQDFAADNNVDAIRVARQLYDACSDRCESFELWQGDWVISTRPPPYLGTSFAGLRVAHQQLVIEMEEAILVSHTLIAQSRRLIERLDRIKSCNLENPSAV